MFFSVWKESIIPKRQFGTWGFSNINSKRRWKVFFIHWIERIFSEFSIFVLCAALILFSSFYQLFIKFISSFYTLLECRKKKYSSKVSNWYFGALSWYFGIYQSVILSVVISLELSATLWYNDANNLIRCGEFGGYNVACHGGYGRGFI